MKLKYQINNKLETFNVADDTIFLTGENENLSQKYKDITLNCDWYDSGYTIFSLKEFVDFNQLKSRLTTTIRDEIYKTNKEISLEGFSLENYHKYVSHDTHLEVIKKTRRLFSEDLKFDDKKIISGIEKIVNAPLSYSPHGSDFKQWI